MAFQPFTLHSALFFAPPLLYLRSLSLNPIQPLLFFVSPPDGQMEEGGGGGGGRRRMQIGEGH